jgi:hypothetical protein
MATIPISTFKMPNHILVERRSNTDAQRSMALFFRGQIVIDERLVARRSF